MIPRRLLSIFLLFITLFSLATGANILNVFPVPSKSHDILGNILSQHLASIGHNVTYISAFAHDEKMLNLHHIQVKEMNKFKETMKNYVRANASLFDIFQQIIGIGNMAKIVFRDRNVQKLLTSNTKFDVMIHLIGMDASLALAHGFDIPIILFVPVSFLPNHVKMLAIPAPPSYVSTMVTPYGENMTFWQRVRNTVIPFFFVHFVEMIFNYLGNEAIKTHLPGYPTIQEIIEQRVDFMLVNSDVSTETPRPYVPNVVQIGGFHLQAPEPLSKDLKAVLDDAKDGFVYVSFGTNVIVKEISPNVLDIIKRTLGKLPLKIVMKYEDDTMPNQPDNFYLRKWFPQQSVLAHPNAKGFISHGGYGGTTESLYHGVPIVCIPFFGDQFKNCADAEGLGYSLTVSLGNFDEEIFSAAVHKALFNETFKKMVQFKSQLYRDQPMNPMDKAVWWIEHVIKHKGAKHLKVKGVELPWYQYHLIDVFIFLSIVISLALAMCFYSCKLFYNLCCGRFVNQQKEKAN